MLWLKVDPCTSYTRLITAKTESIKNNYIICLNVKNLGAVSYACSSESDLAYSKLSILKVQTPQNSEIK